MLRLLSQAFRGYHIYAACNLRKIIYLCDHIVVFSPVLSIPPQEAKCGFLSSIIIEYSGGFTQVGSQDPPQPL